MPTYCEYTTVAKVKTYKDTSLSSTDDLILAMIRQASREIEDITNRWFYPRIVAETYDTPRMGASLRFTHDLLELTTLTNGDGTVITSADYKLYPLNSYPKSELMLLPKQYAWQLDAYGTPYGAISLAAICGYSDDYADAWVDTLATLSAAITIAGQTTVTVPTGLISVGDLLKIGSEYIYASGVAVSTTDTLTMVRGVNGSTAVAHLISTPIYRWNPGAEIEMLVRRAATAYTKLRSNPISETINVDGVTFSTPKDVVKWLDMQLKGMGLIRVGIG